VASVEFSAVSEYICGLIRQDQKVKAKEALEEELVGAINSGPAIVADDAFWERIRSVVSAVAKERPRVNEKKS